MALERGPFYFMSDYKLVYTDDPKLKNKCPKCNELQVNCKCAIQEKVETNQITAVLRIEKNSRGGKIVTVIDRLPKNEEFLKNLCTKLKKQCGTGGTHSFKDGTIEIQGDKKEQIKKILEASGIKSKG